MKKKILCFPLSTIFDGTIQNFKLHLLLFSLELDGKNNLFHKFRTITDVPYIQPCYMEGMFVFQDAIIIIVVRSLPEMFCHLYLSISCPARFIRSLWRKRQFQELAVDYEDEDDIFESIRSSYQGLHVRKLFKIPDPPIE